MNNNQSKPDPELAFIAIENNDQARIMMSLAKGLDPNVRDDQGRTLLIAACQQAGDRHALVDTLLQNGAGLGMVGINGRTALHELCEKSCQSIRTLEMLLMNPVTLNQQDHAGQTPLHALSARGWIEGCTALLDSSTASKGLCNQQDKKGQTAVFLAAEANHSALVCMLVSYGADPRIETKNGQTVLQKISDPQTKAILMMQINALCKAEQNQAKSRIQEDPEFSDLMNNAKFVLARQAVAQAISAEVAEVAELNPFLKESPKNKLKNSSVNRP